MVVVSKERINYEQGIFYQIVKFTKRTKKFSILLPEWTHEYLPENTVYSETYDGVEKAFKRAMREYDEVARYKKKVIVYKFEGNAVLWDETGERVSFRKDDLRFSAGTALSFSYSVVIERQAPGAKEKKYYWLDNRYAFTDYNESRKVMEWTQEREDFCKALKLGLNTMIKGAWEFFNEQGPEQIAVLIDAGVRLLPDSEKEP